MDEFRTKLATLSERISKLKDSISTEEATKNALVMPLIQILGYDVFNPLEVIPEFISDFGIKKGEKVDYVILKDSKPVILIECKHWNEKLDIHNSQLFRYFSVTDAKFAVITNGLEYKFYTDLVKVNKMDEKPFFTFKLDNMTDRSVAQLQKFQKISFNIDEISSTASDLKYTNEIKIYLQKESKDPSEEFIRYCLRKVYPGKATEKVIEQFTSIVKNSFEQLISDLVNTRLQNALKKEDDFSVNNEKDEVPADESKKEILTTNEEVEGFHIIKAIARKKVNLNRVIARDTQSYFGVLLDDNNRKPICRLHFNSITKYISVFDKERKENKYKISSLDEIYKFEKDILDLIESYLSQA